MFMGSFAGSGFSGSVSVDIDKVSVHEDMSMFRASMEEAEGRAVSEKEAEAISNERIREGNELLDTYQVTSRAINGGMGSVWRVYHKNWNVDLAMKRPRPEFFAEGSRERKERFIHECEAWINLGLHPNIVTCYYVREIGGVPTIFSEWMDNGSLEDLIRGGSLYDGTDREIQERILNIAIQFARGLYYAHETGGMIHQDVKPDNLLLSKDWEVKVSDFGLAAASTAANTAPTGGMTKAYCSPEQAGKNVLTIRTDIYSWAVSVMEMYLQGKPWEEKGKITGPKAGQLCREFLKTAKIPVPKRTQELLEWCLRPDPEDRPDNFYVVEKELLSIYTEITGEEFPVPEAEAASGNAASFNNRALSFLDLNHPAEARASWETALAADPGHVESLYNYALWRWRRGETDDADALHFLERGRDGIVKDRLKARLELERGNPEGVTVNADEEDKLFAAHLKPLDLSSRRLPRTANKSPLSKNSSKSAPQNDPAEVVYRKDGVSAQIRSLTDSEKRYMAQRITQVTICGPDMQTLYSFSLPGWGLPPSACFDDGGGLLVVFVDRESCFFDLEKGEVLPYRLPGSCLAVTQTQDGEYYALRGGFQKIEFVDIRTGRCRRSVPLPGLIKIYSADVDRSRLSVSGLAGREADLLYQMNVPVFEYSAAWELSRVHEPSQQLKLERKFRALLFCSESACQKSEYAKALEFVEQAMTLDETLGRDRRAIALRRKILAHGTKTALLAAAPVQTIKSGAGKLWFSRDGALLLFEGKGGARTLNLETGEVTVGIEKEHRLSDQTEESTYWIRVSEGYTAGISRVLRGEGYRYETILEYDENTRGDTEEDIEKGYELRLRGAYIETDGNLIDPRRGKKSEWSVEIGRGYYFDNQLRFLSDQRTLLLMRDLRDEANGHRLCCMFFDMREGSLIREWTIPLCKGALTSTLRLSPDDFLALMRKEINQRDGSGFFRYILTDFDEIVMADGTTREPLPQKPQRIHGKNHSIISNNLRYTGIGDQIMYIKKPGAVSLTQLNCREKELEIQGSFGVPADMAISPDGAFLAVAGSEESGEVSVYQLEWERYFDNEAKGAE